MIYILLQIWNPLIMYGGHLPDFPILKLSGFLLKIFGFGSWYLKLPANDIFKMEVILIRLVFYLVTLIFSNCIHGVQDLPSILL